MTETCPYCEGDKLVSIQGNSIAGGAPDVWEVSCPMCRGAGVVDPTHPDFDEFRVWDMRAVRTAYAGKGG